MKKILVFGNWETGDILDWILGGKYLLSTYGEAYGSQTIDWGYPAIQQFMIEQGAAYDAVLVSWPEKHAVQAVKSSGYKGPVLGIGYHPSELDEITNADALFELGMNNERQLVETIDGLFQ